MELGIGNKLLFRHIYNAGHNTTHSEQTQMQKPTRSSLRCLKLAQSILFSIVKITYKTEKLWKKKV